MKKLSKMLLAALLLSFIMGFVEKGAAQKPTTTAKEQKTPKPMEDQEAVALFIHLYGRYAKNVTDKNEFDKLMEKALEDRQGARERAKRFMDNFQKIPLKQREVMLGKWADVPDKTNIPTERYETVFNQVVLKQNKVDKADFILEKNVPDLSPSEKSIKDSKKIKGGKNSLLEFPSSLDSILLIWEKNNIAPVTNASLQNIGLCYRGLRCREDTGWDGWTASDEIYIVASVIDNGNITTSKLPLGGRHDFDADDCYEDLDAGDKKKGPERYIWHSRTGARQIALVVTVIEHDYSDIDDVVSQIEDFTEMGSTFCEIRGRGFWCNIGTTIVSSMLAFFLADIPVIDGFTDMDDPIESVTWGGDNGDDYISDREMTNYLDAADQEWRDILFDFRTRHNENEGADYRVMFRFQWED